MSKKKIVIIDDEKEILNILEKYFMRKGFFDVIIFDNPIIALDYVLNNDIDLVLTDIMMPEMDGIDVLREIKKKKTQLKVIMMTAYTTLDKTLECEKLGACDYVTKPFISLKDVESKILENIGV